MTTGGIGEKEIHNMGLPTSKTHRTALVIDANTNPERVARLLQSVNDTGIKVDVYTKGAASGTTLRAGAPSDSPTSDGDVDVEAFVSSLGYTMLLTATPVS